MSNTFNRSLRAAKATKQDEFYTQLSDIEKELRLYTKHFKNNRKSNKLSALASLRYQRFEARSSLQGQTRRYGLAPGGLRLGWHRALRRALQNRAPNAAPTHPSHNRGQPVGRFLLEIGTRLRETRRTAPAAVRAKQEQSGESHMGTVTSLHQKCRCQTVKKHYLSLSQASGSRPMFAPGEEHLLA